MARDLRVVGVQWRVARQWPRRELVVAVRTIEEWLSSQSTSSVSAQSNRRRSRLSSAAAADAPSISRTWTPRRKSRVESAHDKEKNKTSCGRLKSSRKFAREHTHTHTHCFYFVPCFRIAGPCVACSTASVKRCVWANEKVFFFFNDSSAEELVRTPLKRKNSAVRESGWNGFWKPCSAQGADRYSKFESRNALHFCQSRYFPHELAWLQAKRCGVRLSLHGLRGCELSLLAEEDAASVNL